MSKPLLIWVITYNPSDLPGKYVVRIHEVAAGGTYRVHPEAWVRDTLDEARHVIEVNAPGSCRLDRDPSDDPVIVESWV